MIATVWRLGWLNLRRDRPALVLTFIVPLLFFSIFAAVFGGMDEKRAARVEVAFVLEDDTAAASRLVALAGREARLAVRPAGAGALTRAAATEMVRSGQLDVAVVVPAGFAAALGRPLAARPRLELLVDRAHPLAEGLVQGVLQGVAFELLLEELRGQGLPLPVAPSAPAVSGGEEDRGLVAIRVEDVLGAPGKPPSVAYFAAGIGVMFLLFAVAGRSAILIEERESGVLARVLSCRAGVAPFLVGRWLFLTTLGFVQVGLMFAWGGLAFGLELATPRHLAGFLAMTAAAAAAAAALGLLLSVACRTRAQLSGISIVLVLVMSALGGSMFPRFLMPPRLQTLGLATFNAWALDGYQKVFWYESPLSGLLPQLAVLAALTLLFLGAALAVGARRGA